VFAVGPAGQQWNVIALASQEPGTQRRWMALDLVVFFEKKTGETSINFRIF